MRAFSIGIAFALTLGLTSTPLPAQTWRPPADSQRCPSKWGAGDERGAGNHMTPATVLRAAQPHQDGRDDRAGAPAWGGHADLRPRDNSTSTPSGRS